MLLTAVAGSSLGALSSVALASRTSMRTNGPTGTATVVPPAVNDCAASVVFSAMRAAPVMLRSSLLSSKEPVAKPATPSADTMKLPDAPETPTSSTWGSAAGSTYMESAALATVSCSEPLRFSIAKSPVTSRPSTVSVASVAARRKCDSAETVSISRAKTPSKVARLILVVSSTASWAVTPSGEIVICDSAASPTAPGVVTISADTSPAISVNSIVDPVNPATRRDPSGNCSNERVLLVIVWPRTVIDPSAVNTKPNGSALIVTASVGEPSLSGPAPRSFARSSGGPRSGYRASVSLVGSARPIVLLASRMPIESRSKPS